MLEAQKELKIFADGSFNKISFGCCYVVLDCSGRQPKEKKRGLFVINSVKNVCDIEYLAVIYALESNPFSCVVYTDSLQVYLELNLKLKPKNQRLFKIARELMEKNNCEVKKCCRDENPAGIFLEKRLRKLHRDTWEVLHPTPRTIRRRRNG